MKKLNIMLTAAIVSSALAAPALAQSTYERTQGYGNTTVLGTGDRGYATETVAPVAGPGEMKSGNINKRGPARGDAFYDDYSYGAFGDDRAMGNGNRSKIGQF